MKKAPLAVAISALVSDEHILLIKRSGGDYAGMLGLPGGKIEKDEHLSEAAMREIREETGIEADFSAHLGVVSEHLVEGGSVQAHFLLHLCELEPHETGIGHDAGEMVGWYRLDELSGMRDAIIPSDLVMIERMVQEQGAGYYECVLEKRGPDHLLRRFEPVSGHADS